MRTLNSAMHFVLVHCTAVAVQSVMNAAAHFVSDTRQFGHDLTQFLHGDMYWLDVQSEPYMPISANHIGVS